jgi:hemerythrin-like domain-containing protein
MYPILYTKFIKNKKKLFTLGGFYTMDTTNLERQHQDFLDLINKIAIHRSEEQIKNNAATISLLLSQLSGKLKVHAISEDKFLYPALMNHQDPKVKATSQAFYTEMGGLAISFDNFKTNFATSNKIIANPGAFLTESQKVFTAFKKRIDRENNDLYPLVSI